MTRGPGSTSSASRAEPLYRVLARDGEELRLVGAGPTQPSRIVRGSAMPGDWVRLHGDRLEIVAPYRSATPFPPPSGEAYRLLGPRLGNLKRRDEVMRAIRAYFQAEGFLEVETPLLVRAPGLEVHLDVMTAQDGYLNTSPEYQMKRLLVAGVGDIFQICKCFRNGESGPRHNPEFTMLEWYRSPGSYEEMMQDCERLLAAILPADRADLRPPVERISMRQAFERYAGCAVPSDEESFWPIYLEKIEPHLGQRQPTILYDWPSYLAALARRKPDDPAVAERFELYAGGVELCNAYTELTDPVEQRERLEADLRTRQRLGKPVYPIDERFLAALEEGMPPAGGAALGLDRLVALTAGAQTIEEVLAFSSRER